MHVGETWRDYSTGFTTCPALEALDRAQSRRANDPADKAERDAGRNPDRSRFWVALTKAEAAIRNMLT